MQAFLISKSYHSILGSLNVLPCILWLKSYQLGSGLHRCMPNTDINHQFAVCSIFPVTKLINCDDSPPNNKATRAEVSLISDIKNVHGAVVAGKLMDSKAPRHWGSNAESPGHQLLLQEQGQRCHPAAAQTDMSCLAAMQLGWMCSDRAAAQSFLHKVTCWGAAGGNPPLRCTARRSCGCWLGWFHAHHTLKLYSTAMKINNVN